ncbi:MAG: CPBP family intramembrane metalloprotease [Clostridiales bacterium]|nr:CPBP family intramembrane metalloprotease [Clostridiales bacterium]
MQTLSNQNKWKIWQGFLFQAVAVAMLATIGAWMQRSWGLYGLVTTELMFLIYAIAIVLFHKTPLKEVFPLKLPSLRDIGGLIIFFIAGFHLNMLSIGISLMVLPKNVTNPEIVSLNEALAGPGMSAVALLLIEAVLPAICEESLERGMVLSHLRSIKKDWLIAVIMGIFFGIIHLSPTRFLNTACLGAVLSYIMVKKNNFVLPMLFHFSNNFLSWSAQQFSKNFMSHGGSQIVKSASSIDLSSFGYIYFIMGFLAPILLVTANLVLCPKAHKAKHFIVAGILSLALFITGMGMIFSNTFGKGIAVNENKNFIISEAVTEKEFFVIEEDSNYILSSVVSIPVEAGVEIVNEETGNVVASQKGKGNITMMKASEKFLKGKYILRISVDEPAENIKVNAQIMMVKMNS